MSALALTACATRPPLLAEDRGRELIAAPFFPQTIHQCGPAALATILVASGVATTPDQLAPEVYIPGRRGSLQVELLAAARRQGRLAYVLTPGFDTLRAELAAGNPVLVLQDLGALHIRRWHFAVLIGYDPATDVVILRSGTERRRLETRARFLHSLQAGNFWAVVVSDPARLPVTATAAGAINALTDAERFLTPAALDAGHAVALQRWPTDPLVLFAAGNRAYAAGRIADAATNYRQLLAVQPAHVAGRNNLANLLLDEGCPAAALAQARAATGSSTPASPLWAAIQDTLERATREVSNAMPDPARCAAMAGAGAAGS